MKNAEALFSVHALAQSLTVLLPSGDKSIEKTRIVHCIVKVSVSRRVPEALVAGGASRAGEERLLADAWISGLVECKNLDVVVCVFLNDPSGVVVGIEGIHEDEWDVDVVSGVEVLDLADGEVEEGHAFANLDYTLRSGAGGAYMCKWVDVHACECNNNDSPSHGCSETSIELEYGELV